MAEVRPLPKLMSAEKNRHVSQVFRDMGQRLMRFIRARVPSDADAEDVSQEVWQQLTTTLDAGPIQQVSAWLYTVARNRIIDRSRRPATTSLDAPVSEADDDDSHLDLSAFVLRDDNTPRTAYLRRQFWDQLYAALAELPEEQRQVFVWHELEALSFQDIAELTGENQNTLLARKRYAVLHLRQRLEPLRAEFSEPKHS